jgi:sugar phosphate isomerase/epimerase
MALGVQLYSVKDNLAPAVLPHTLERLAAMGFSHAEPYDILSDTAGLGAAASAAGLQLRAAHANIVTLDADRILDAAAALGIGTVIVPWTDPESIRDRDGVLRLADAINGTVDAAAARGIRLGYHNHDFEFATTIDGAGTSAWELLVQALDDRVVLELDTFWAGIGGGDVVEILGRLGERIPYLHVKNEPPDPDDPPFAGPDITGRLDEVVAAAPALEMPVVEVVVDDGDVYPVLERNARFFAGLVAGRPA